MQLNTPLTLLLGCCLLTGPVTFLSAAEGEAPQQQASAQPSDALVTVNDRTITQALYGAFQRSRQTGHPTAPMSQQQQLAVLNELVNFVLLEQDAVAKNLDQNPGVAAQLELGRTRLLASAAIGDHLRSQSISDAELQADYEREIKENPVMEYKLRHILLESQEEAEAVVSALDKGEDFLQLAKTKSTDPSSKTEGDLGWLSAGQMEPSVQQAAEQMEEGSYSKAPVKSDFGWHVLLLEQRRQVPQPSFEEVKADLLQKKQQALLAGYIQELRSKANLVVDAQQPPPEAGADAAEEKPKAEE